MPDDFGTLAALAERQGVGAALRPVVEKELFYTIRIGLEAVNVSFCAWGITEPKVIQRKQGTVLPIQKPSQMPAATAVLSCPVQEYHHSPGYHPSGTQHCQHSPEPRRKSSLCDNPVPSSPI